MAQLQPLALPNRFTLPFLGLADRSPPTPGGLFCTFANRVMGIADSWSQWLHVRLSPTQKCLDRIRIICAEKADIKRILNQAEDFPPLGSSPLPGSRNYPESIQRG